MVLKRFFVKRKLEAPSEDEISEALRAGKDEIEIRLLSTVIVETEEWDVTSVNETDRIASEWVIKLRSQISKGSKSKKTYICVGDWSDRRWYTRPKDAWVDEEFWLEAAEKWWEKTRWEDSAQIMIMNGDFRCVPRFQQLVDECEKGLWHDGEEEFLILLRDHVSFDDDSIEWEIFPKVYGEPPYRITDKWIRAIRAQFEKRQLDEDDLEEVMTVAAKLRRQEIERFFEAEEVVRLKQACSDLLFRENKQFPSIEEDALNLVEEMGWGDLGIELMRQTWFERVLYDPEWGVSSSGEILQWLSLICPGPEVAKHCARILGEDPKELVNKLGLDKWSTGWLSSNHAGWVRNAQSRAAIAWLRCREVM
ncbi:MAG: hypothetical protein GXP30_08905 [Verrucomicrobia bacterium]|nr:hypothetical protein [Verrucomicrobiota bacterium]